MHTPEHIVIKRETTDNPARRIEKHLLLLANIFMMRLYSANVLFLFIPLRKLVSEKVNIRLFDYIDQSVGAFVRLHDFAKVLHYIVRCDTYEHKTLKSIMFSIVCIW